MRSQPNVVLGLALFYGGMVQFAAGMWEFVRLPPKTKTQ